MDVPMLELVNYVANCPRRQQLKNRKEILGSGTSQISYIMCWSHSKQCSKNENFDMERTEHQLNSDNSKEEAL